MSGLRIMGFKTTRLRETALTRPAGEECSHHDPGVREEPCLLLVRRGMIMLGIININSCEEEEMNMRGIELVTRVSS